MRSQMHQKLGDYAKPLPKPYSGLVAGFEPTAG